MQLTNCMTYWRINADNNFSLKLLWFREKLIISWSNYQYSPILKYVPINQPPFWPAHRPMKLELLHLQKVSAQKVQIEIIVSQSWLCHNIIMCMMILHEKGKAYEEKYLLSSKTSRDTITPLHVWQQSALKSSLPFLISLGTTSKPNHQLRSVSIILNNGNCPQTR